MTFEPSVWNCSCTSWAALCPSDTMVGTAAMPMTTPRMVSPERSLFLASVRKEIWIRSNRSIPLPHEGADFHPRHDLLVFGEVALDELRELVLDEPERNGHGPQEAGLCRPAL